MYILDAGPGIVPFRFCRNSSSHPKKKKGGVATRVGCSFQASLAQGEHRAAASPPHVTGIDHRRIHILLTFFIRGCGWLYIPRRQRQTPFQNWESTPPCQGGRANRSPSIVSVEGTRTSSPFPWLSFRTCFVLGTVSVSTCRDPNPFGGMPIDRSVCDMYRSCPVASYIQSPHSVLTFIFGAEVRRHLDGT